jgi:hypothetical protein|tara:strand:+ start:111 stop:869 length:759 start_codon:yes stop_codon:yes gene_type:complete
MKLLFENWRKFIKENQSGASDVFSEVAANTMSAMSVFKDDDTLAEEMTQHDYIASLASNPDLEVVEKFANSLYAGKRSGFLSYYSPEELESMDLYLINGHDAGFAIKDGDDIVSVHNNSELRGLGSEFMRKAKEVGGSKLDHFDGFLSGLYRRYGFTDVYAIYQWDEQYKPKNWNYDQVDINNPETSVYAEVEVRSEVEEGGEQLVQFRELEHTEETIEVKAEDNFEVEINPNLKANYYKYGRPDVIMRKLA